MRSLTGLDRQAEIRRQQVILAKLERGFRRQIAAEIVQQFRVMVAKFSLTGDVPAIPNGADARMFELFERMTARSIEAMGIRLLDQGKGAGHRIERKDFSGLFLRLSGEFVRQELIRQRILGINRTTRQSIVSAVDIGRAEGLGQTALAKRIMESVPGISLRRGGLIARTETHNAANYGAQKAAESTGLVIVKEWISVTGDRTREDHQEADGQTRQLDQPFDVGGEALMFPGDPNGAPENTINCRCGVAHMVVD